MKKAFAIILVLLNFSCKKSEETNIKKLVIHSVNINIDTAVRVDCKDFETTFANVLKIDSIKDKPTLNKFETLLTATNKSKNDVLLDVRKKIFVFYNNNSVDTICVDRFNILINNQLIDRNNIFTSYILNL